LLVGALGLSAMDTETELYFQGGTMTPDSFKFDVFWADLGFNLNVLLGDLVIITPECDLVIQDLKFKKMQLAPALIGNLKIGNFFIGAGPTKWFKLGAESVTSDWMLKINLGLTKYRMIYTLFAIVDFSNDSYNSLIGIKLGFNL
jgi:hypothetical protein